MLNTYKTIAGDTWDIIAYKVYGDCKYMDKLLKANVQQATTAVFSAGVVLKTPEVDIMMASTLPPWKR